MRGARLEKRGRIWYARYWCNGERVRVSTKCTDRKAAEIYARELVFEETQSRLLEIIQKQMTSKPLIVSVPDEPEESAATLEAEGIALINRIEAATKEQPSLRQWLPQPNPFQRGEPLFLRRQLGMLNLIPQGHLRHVLPTLGGCAFDPDEPEPREWVPSEVEWKQRDQHWQLWFRWHRVHTGGSTTSTCEALRTHSRVHSEFAGCPAFQAIPVFPPAVPGCAYCELSSEFYHDRITRECAAYVLRRLARPRAGERALTVQELIEEWSKKNEGR